MISLPVLHQGVFHLLIHPHPTLDGGLLELAAKLAASGPLLTLDGGNCFNIYPVARALRQQNADVQAALTRLRFARAFTCFQMAAALSTAAALHQTISSGPTEPDAPRTVLAAPNAVLAAPNAVLAALNAVLAAPNTVLVLDFLATFRDESVPFTERCRLLANCLPSLRALRQSATLLVSVRPAEPELIDPLAAAADQVWCPAISSLRLPTPQQPILRLFEG